jgi:hypothetical protein
MPAKGCKGLSNETYASVAAREPDMSDMIKRRTGATIIKYRP